MSIPVTWCRRRDRRGCTSGSRHSRCAPFAQWPDQTSQCGLMNLPNQHCAAPLKVAATSRWLCALSVSCPMQRLEMSPPVLRPAAELSCRIHGMARMRSCASSRFVAVMRCISTAPAARSHDWLATAERGAHAATSRHDSGVERQARQVGNGPHRAHCDRTSRATGEPSNMLRSLQMEGGARGLGPPACGAASPAVPSAGRSSPAPTAGSLTLVYLECPDMCGMGAPAPVLGPAPRACKCAHGWAPTPIAHMHPSPHVTACERPTTPVHPAGTQVARTAQDWMMVPAPNTGPAPPIMCACRRGAPEWATAPPAPSATYDLLPLLLVLVPTDGGVP